MSAADHQSAVQIAGPSTVTQTNDVTQKKKSKRRKRSDSPLDFEDGPVPEGDMDAEEFYVDAIMHAVYKPYAASRRKPGLAWHYTAQWHGYPLTQTSSEEPITHDMFSEGTTFVTEFWKYAKADFQAARSTTGSRDAHPSEPVGKEGDVVLCPKQLLHKWYRSALRSYRRDKRANALRLAKRPDDHALKRARKDLIWWVKRTKIDVVGLAQECGQRGLPLLPDESETEDSESEEEEKKKRQEQEDEERRRRKRKKKKREERERAAALASTQAGSSSKASGSKDKDTEANRSKRKDKEKRKKASSPNESPERSRPWSPGLYDDGGSPGRKQKEKRQRELERLRKIWEEKKASEDAANAVSGNRPTASNPMPKQKRIVVLSDSESTLTEEEEQDPMAVKVAKTPVASTAESSRLKDTKSTSSNATMSTHVSRDKAVTKAATQASLQQPLFDNHDDMEEEIMNSRVSEGDSAAGKSSNKSFTPIWERSTNTQSASPYQAVTPTVPVVASARQPAQLELPTALAANTNANPPSASVEVGDSSSAPARTSSKAAVAVPASVTSQTAVPLSQNGQRPIQPQPSTSRPSVVTARQTSKSEQKILCEVNIRLEGMAYRTTVFEAEMKVQPALTMINPQDLFEGQAKRLVISRILDLHVNQDILAPRMVLAHAAFSAPPTSNVASTNRRISELLFELGNADMGEGLALAVTKRGIAAVLYSTASPFGDVVKPPASLRETYGLLVTFLAFDHQDHHKTSDAAVAAFDVLRNVIPAPELHPNIILGSLGFTTDFFRRLRGRKVTVIAQAFRSKIEDGLSRSETVQVNISEKPEIVILDEEALRELRERRGVRDLAERGTEFWVYGATIPPKTNPFWAPTRVFQMEGGIVLLLASWLLTNSDRALSLAQRIRRTPGWTACVTIQTVFLLFQITRRESKADWDVKFAATELLSVLPLVQIRFPLPRSHQEIQRIEGIQAWSKATTSQERLRVAASHRHIGMDPVSLDIINDFRIHVDKQLAEVDRAAESDMIQRLHQKSSHTTNFKRMLIIDSDSRIKHPIRHIDADAFDKFLDSAGLLSDIAEMKI